MNYNPNKYYRIGYLKAFIMLIPLFVLANIIDDVSFHIQPSLFIIIPVILGQEYSYIFPRRAMEVYENILFRTFRKRIDIIGEFLVLGAVIGTVVYYINTRNPILLLILLIINFLWNYGFKQQTLVIGDKSIIVGNKLIPHSDINSIYLQKKSIIINTKEREFDISDWMIRKRKWQLERAVQNILKL